MEQVSTPARLLYGIENLLDIYYNREELEPQWLVVIAGLLKDTPQKPIILMPTTEKAAFGTSFSSINPTSIKRPPRSNFGPQQLVKKNMDVDSFIDTLHDDFSAINLDQPGQVHVYKGRKPQVQLDVEKMIREAFEEPSQSSHSSNGAVIPQLSEDKGPEEKDPQSKASETSETKTDTTSEISINVEEIKTSKSKESKPTVTQILPPVSTTVQNNSQNQNKNIQKTSATIEPTKIVGDTKLAPKVEVRTSNNQNKAQHKVSNSMTKVTSLNQNNKNASINQPSLLPTIVQMNKTKSKKANGSIVSSKQSTNSSVNNSFSSKNPPPTSQHNISVRTDGGPSKPIITTEKNEAANFKGNKNIDNHGPVSYQKHEHSVAATQQSAGWEKVTSPKVESLDAIIKNQQIEEQREKARIRDITPKKTTPVTTARPTKKWGPVSVCDANLNDIMSEEGKQNVYRNNKPRRKNNDQNSNTGTVESGQNRPISIGSANAIPSEQQKSNSGSEFWSIAAKKNQVGNSGKKKP